MSGPTTFTANMVSIQLACVENDIEVDFWADEPPRNYDLKWKRHYLLKRLLAIQIRDFNRE